MKLPKMNLQFYAGPQIGHGFKIHESEETEIDDLKLLDKEFSTLDFSLNTGLHFSFNGPIIGLNYNHGFSNLGIENVESKKNIISSCIDVWSF